jgi:site-specific DNA-methyltransferase (adenine-specific)
VPKLFWEQLATASGAALRSQPADSRAVVLLSVNSEPRERAVAPTGDGLTADSAHLLDECVRMLRPGGLLFIYGHPGELPLWGEQLFAAGGESRRMVFKYWIALGIDDAPRADFLKPMHRGLLMLLKDDPKRKKPAAPPLNNAEVKVAHQFCAACKQNVKDWGGKKHLMNPKGAALSDVWRDLPKSRLRDSVAPDCVLERIRALTASEGVSGLHIIQLPSKKSERRTPVRPVSEITSDRADQSIGAPVFEPDQVHLGDCVSFLAGVAAAHPEGVFDLAFADPPYNLAKNYANYDDTLADQHYLDWCNQWLDGMARTLKPGGSLFVLNLPKWALHHAALLNSRLEFRHWVVWEALSDPRGKLMPAHYALLYYTKPGAKPVFNYTPPGKHSVGDAVLPPDAPKYCLRAACVKQRKSAGDDEKVELSDIWSDIHRIKHKRDRDAHPCQLPDKLMERIIRLTTNRGGLVFDPFCGTGTTAIAARKLGRHFVMTECDAKYVRITNEKLVAMKEHADLFGEFIVPRKSTRHERGFTTKKAVETFLQQLAQKLGRVPTEEEIHRADGEMLAAIDRIYPNRGAALKRCKVALA